MAHDAQRAFCRRTRVLEIGSLNVNGTIRECFVEPIEYVGIDCHPGPGVDVVAIAHEWRGRPESFDVVCSCEAFEHDPHAAATIANMLRHLKPGGLFLSTCAGIGRPEHGTRRTGVKSGWGPNADFYRNVTIELMLEWLGSPLDDLFASIYVEHNPHAADLYCMAIRRPNTE
jgi:SAM-dependent methyltransferase